MRASTADELVGFSQAAPALAGELKQYAALTAWNVRRLELLASDAELPGLLNTEPHEIVAALQGAEPEVVHVLVPKVFRA